MSSICVLQKQVILPHVECETRLHLEGNLCSDGGRLSGGDRRGEPAGGFQEAGDDASDELKEEVDR